QPDFRGTYGLVPSCLITLGLFVWTAVHLDVPVQTFQGRLLPYWRKVKWVLLGMLAPELLLFIACLQYWTSHNVQREAKRLENVQSCMSSLRCSRSLILMIQLQFDLENEFMYRKYSWTPVHSFYASMGGFVFDVPQRHDSFLPDNQTRITH
ncbi:hypothetical protein BDP27DRAFT_1519660, partial [Rhodocollybia butyracea]